MRAPLIVALCSVAAIATALHAQGDALPLGVQGTMSLNATWNAAENGVTFPGTNSGLRAGALRFGGRAAARVAPRLFVGMSVASWQFDFTRFTASRDIDAVSEGVVVGPYVQWYPARKSPLFLRGGAGYANTWAFLGSGNVIQGYRGNRVASSVGAGGDVSLRAHLALTLSLDYTRVFNAVNFAESTSALVAGVGLTVH